MFSTQELLEIAQAVKLSLPDSDEKDSILQKITKTIEIEGSHPQKQEINTINGIPDQPGELWYNDLAKHREFYYGLVPHGSHSFLEEKRFKGDPL